MNRTELGTLLEVPTTRKGMTMVARLMQNPDGTLIVDFRQRVDSAAETDHRGFTKSGFCLEVTAIPMLEELVNRFKLATEKAGK